MKKDRLILIGFVIIFIIGQIILEKSISLASNEVTQILGEHGRSSNSEIFIVYLEQSITKHKLLGVVLSIFGGLGILKKIT